jgi:phenylacetate-coenzyme A ligase PaaK-like adenylate-forming protein
MKNLTDRIRSFTTVEETEDFFLGLRPEVSKAIRGTQVLSVFERSREELLKNSIWMQRIREVLKVSPGPDVDREIAEALPSFLEVEHWKAKIERELSWPRAVDEFYEGPKSEALLGIRGLGIVLHICPGNSFFGGVESFLHGLVVGNVNLVRLSSKTAPVALVLQELFESSGLPPFQLQFVQWKTGDRQIERVFKQSVEGLSVWGGEGAVETYKNELSSGVSFIEFGPKLSLSVLTQKGISDLGALKGLAKDACRYEQASCSSSQILFVERSRSEDLKTFRAQTLEQLSRAFKAYNSSNPPAQKTKHQQMEVLKAFERAKLSKALGEGDFQSGYPDWLLIWNEGKKILPSPLFRSLLIYDYEHLTELQEMLRPARHFLQTASVAADASELLELTNFLWSLGVNRVVEAGRSTERTEGAPHDGNFMLPRFCRMVSLEAPRRRENLWQLANSDAQFSKLKNLIQAASLAPFYRKRFEEAGLKNAELKNWKDFHSIPKLTKEDLYAYGPPKSYDCLTKRAEDLTEANLFTTGGSTGAPKFTFYSREEWDEVGDIFCAEFKSSGLSSKDRVANLFHGGGLWTAFLATAKGLEKLGAVMVPFGDGMDPVRVLELMRDFKVTASFGLPSTYLKLAQTAREKDLKVKIQKILYGGEALTESAKKFIAETFSAEIVKSGSYAAVDAGCIGYQCLKAKGSIHHVLENYVHLEICDEATGLPVKPGEEGEVVVTNLSRRLFPVVRLKVGDRAREVLEPCACGSRAMTFELLGRNDDLVRFGGANIFVSDVEKLCEKFPEALSRLYQLRLTKKGVDDFYELCIELHSTLKTPTEELKQNIEREYFQIAEHLKKTMDEGFLRHFKLSLVPAGTLVGNANTGKIKRVIDLRNQKAE